MIATDFHRTPFIGREKELATLAELLDAADRGEGGVVLIGGEPGIGKTRLLAEFAARAKTVGWLVLTGRCYDSEGMAAYGPFTEAIRAYVATIGPEDLKRRF